MPFGEGTNSIWIYFAFCAANKNGRPKGRPLAQTFLREKLADEQRYAYHRHCDYQRRNQHHHSKPAGKGAGALLGSLKESHI